MGWRRILGWPAWREDPDYIGDGLRDALDPRSRNA
jgi:hypothetical protein